MIAVPSILCIGMSFIIKQLVFKPKEISFLSRKLISHEIFDPGVGTFSEFYLKLKFKVAKLFFCDNVMSSRLTFRSHPGPLKPLLRPTHPWSGN